ncbi:MAG TPA: hypothetical protein VHG09_07875 [Longimicrobiales bacterium]|nr:hypothetical protein [Longimicrobiales bacterium]
MNNINWRSPLAGVLLATLVVACENPVSHEEDHAEPEGVLIRAGAAEVARIEGSGEAAVVTGALSVTAGGESPVLTVSFIDHDGHDVAFDPHEYGLDVQSADSATAIWQGSVAGSFTGRVSGLSEGVTTLTFQLHHGAADSGHADGDPYVLPVTVTAIAP